MRGGFYEDKKRVERGVVAYFHPWVYSVVRVRVLKRPVLPCAVCYWRPRGLLPPELPPLDEGVRPPPPLLGLLPLRSKPPPLGRS